MAVSTCAAGAAAHGYLARESTEHTLWEMVAWLDKWVKNAPAAGEDKATSSKDMRVPENGQN